MGQQRPNFNTAITDCLQVGDSRVLRSRSSSVRTPESRPPPTKTGAGYLQFGHRNRLFPTKKNRILTHTFLILHRNFCYRYSIYFKNLQDTTERNYYIKRQKYFQLQIFGSKKCLMRFQFRIYRIRNVRWGRIRPQKQKSPNPLHCLNDSRENL